MNSIKNAKKLRKEELKSISGGIIVKPDLSLCGCSCSGSVTGPSYCVTLIACTQGYNCDQGI
ncbi:hypothetical protein [Chryseobacterium sp.]|uniref:hypothetical protein n=1 Tax=Chryseobacterium sp. TaxID=1871047 RepID=UPI00321A3349